MAWCRVYIASAHLDIKLQIIHYFVVVVRQKKGALGFLLEKSGHLKDLIRLDKERMMAIFCKCINLALNQSKDTTRLINNGTIFSFYFKALEVRPSKAWRT